MNPFLDFRPGGAGADGLQDNPSGPSPVANYSAGPLTWQPNTFIFSPNIPCPTLSGCGSNTYNVFSVSQNFKTPYFYNYNLQVEKGFGNAAVFQVGYVGSQGRKLNLVSNINQTTAAHPNPSFPNFGSILQLNSTGTSNYNSLQSTFRIRSWHRLTSQFAYTWAHSQDEISE